MSVLEIIAAILLILACIFIVLVVLMQDSKQGMSQAISGASADNYFQKNSSRTREAKLARFTKIAAVVIFVVALLVNVFTVINSKSSNDNSNVNAVTTTTTTSPEEEGEGESTEAGNNTEDNNAEGDTTESENTDESEVSESEE